MDFKKLIKITDSLNPSIEELGTNIEMVKDYYDLLMKEGNFEGDAQLAEIGAKIEDLLQAFNSYK